MVFKQKNPHEDKSLKAIVGKKFIPIPYFTNNDLLSNIIKIISKIAIKNVRIK